ncbi:GNAT family N-acetyltransferase [Pseudooceanicola sp. C21-150M6]|uniref:GNAT family N-acetyltransferase n=1 Tax=Pseudooceanicola sp. C21-150M6 TaxID=3434355 RepID=UPI003D7FFC7C
MSTDIKIPEFDTKRIHLRGGVLTDIDPLDAFFSSDDSRYVGGPNPRAHTWQALCAGIGHWALRGFGLWMLTDKADGTVMGVAGLQQPDGYPEPELIWVIFNEFSGQGLAKEAVNGIRGFIAREYGITRPISLLYPEYKTVVKMAESIGAQRIEDIEIPDGLVPAWRHAEPGV